MTPPTKLLPLALGTVMVVAVIAAVGIRSASPGSTAAAGAASSNAEAEPASTVAIERGDLVETVSSVGEIGHGESWAAAIDATGVVTARSESGTVIESGQPLIWLDARPVFLVEGSTPLYRTLEFVRDTSGKLQTGPDVAQLQEFLISQGFDDAAGLQPDGTFGASTTRAVKAWQTANELAATGRIDRSQVVFHPGPLRVESEPRLGSTFGELLVTDPAQQVTATFAATQRSVLPVGADVSLEVGDGGVIAGSITDVVDSVADDGTRQLKVSIAAAAPLPDGSDRVSVSVVKVVATDVLIVPVRSVLALAGGGYGLELATPTGAELRAVDIGSVVDDLVEIDGDYVEGDLVIIPTDSVGA